MFSFFFLQFYITPITMSFVFRRCFKANNFYLPVNGNKPTTALQFSRNYSDDQYYGENQFSNSSIMVENGLNVQELPLVVKKLRNLSDFDQKQPPEPDKYRSDTNNYKVIKEEFNQCMDLRDVFSLLTKCTKITPNIALGAIERIYDLEKNPTAISITTDNISVHINIAKGAILEKLLKVVMKTEDTQTILNILNTVSIFMEPYKPKFSDELLLRVIDNKLSIEQLCKFIEFLIKNKSDKNYTETIDKLWVGFLERESDINEKNISQVLNILHGFKSSKKTVLALLEQKLSDIWFKINVETMQNILNVFVQEKYISVQSFAVVGTWMYANIHALDQENMLDIISKLTRLNYCDDQIEKTLEKYMKLKGAKINAHVFIIGILNYCQHFQIRNEIILNACCEYFLHKSNNVPLSFMKSLIYPFGYLCFDPLKSTEFWNLTENILDENFYKVSTENVCHILLSFIYNRKYPSNFVNRLFSSEYLLKVNNPQTMQKLHLIDTALSLECPEHSPMLPKDQWSKPVPQDPRIRNITEKVKDLFQSIAGGPDKLSTCVMVPHIYSHNTYLIDIMIHPAGLGSSNSNWKSKSNRNENIAILIHLPDHYCSDGTLIGPQTMRKRHLRILGMKVASLKYSTISQFYTSCNLTGLRQYLADNISNPEHCIDN